MKPEIFYERLRQAASRVRGMDQVDGYKERGLMTIAAALESGIRMDETNGAQFDALFMLLDRAGRLDLMEERKL